MATATSFLGILLVKKQRSSLTLLLASLAIFPTSFIRSCGNCRAHGFFVKTTIATRRIHHSVLIYCTASKSSDQEKNGGEEDGQYSNIGSDDDDDTVQAVPMPPREAIILPRQLPNDVLISIEEKERRERERSLLTKIEEGDEAIKEIRRLWCSQSGISREENLLYQASKGIGDPRQWEQAKEILERLTVENPTFLEPFARLSKLYCLMGRLEDSNIMAQEVLKLKPWHILAIETMVATSYALNQIESSVYWASQRMPPPSQTAKRKEWIFRAIENSLEFENELLLLQYDEEQEMQNDNSFCSNDKNYPSIEKDEWQ